ncbi:MAG: hypothetical protein CMI54_06515 [Parcubacteria group bacterium]|nr:hypothetical protein [Parcubacteria group bacterium]|tara:strand:+ start:18213 stop:19748 length:1536 start_codon:yes stop_codon:yes gene_type:complete
MIFIGTYERKLVKQKSLSFRMNSVSISNVLGEASFGVSGEGNSLELKFKKGKIYDFENNYVSSYDPSSIFEISGDISETLYNYSIDGRSIARGRPKNKFSIEKFYINTHLCELRTNLYIYGEEINYDFTFPSTSQSGEVFNVALNNIAPASEPEEAKADESNRMSISSEIHVFSAKLKGSSATNFTLNSYPTTGIASGTSGNFSLTYVGSASAGVYGIELEIDTNIGTISTISPIQITIPEIIITLNTFEEFDENAASNFLSEGLKKTNTGTFVYNSYVQGNHAQAVKPSLEYIEGNVGTFYRVTGVELINAGAGYDQNGATLTFSEGITGDVRAEGEVVMNADGTVSDVTITNPGAYFESLPTLTFTGDFSDPVDPDNKHAEGNSWAETYTKTFFDSWDIAVGTSPDALISYNTGGVLYWNYRGEAPYDYQSFGPGIYEHANSTSISSSQNLYIKVISYTFYDLHPMKVKLKVTAAVPDSSSGKNSEEFILTCGNMPITTTASIAMGEKD